LFFALAEQPVRDDCCGRFLVAVVRPRRVCRREGEFPRCRRRNGSVPLARYLSGAPACSALFANPRCELIIARVSSSIRVSGGSHSRRRPVPARVFLWRVSDVAGGFRRHDSATLEPCSVSTAPDETLRRAGASKFGCPGLLLSLGSSTIQCRELGGCEYSLEHEQ